MILVDTCVWIDFFRGQGHAHALADRLETGDVLLHPWVLGEVALGNLGPKRRQVLDDLRLLPRINVVSDERVLDVVEAKRLIATGIGWVDAHLLVAVAELDAALWTTDRPLRRAAEVLRIRLWPSAG